MPRHPLPPEQRRVSRSLRLTAEQWDALDRWARERHQSAAEVMRGALERLMGTAWPDGDGKG